MKQPVHYYSDAKPITSIESSFLSCNCACSRCLSGDCCMAAPYTGTWPPTTTTAASTILGGRVECGPIDHDFAPIDPARLYCRKCGTTRKV